ncbi:MAG TPA: Asp-tRNA(Asn)/Glu-tRNA(Gln) amidotransferase subunit GatB, partial [Gammaproteobacteria bacterium]|nr:Asp-tRNA(Asn)/Glu-tRNA(Gln) amidotransferase subunit GatB [Gammaproteobacteria bacterium]
AEIAERSVFARKNYFYPDLPKGYQISQYELPVVKGGRLVIALADGSRKTIGITRAHLEEDAGKSLHENFADATGIDLNRAGVPLLEIVSEPELRSAAEAVAYMKAIHSLVRYLGICDGNMQEGSLRCDANVSIHRPGKAFGTRAEIKNLNSFRFVEQAIEYEIARQAEILEAGGAVVQETRLYDPDRHETRPMRAKEEANDYRYFPDPDLLPLVIERSFIEGVRDQLPELPAAKRARFESEYGLSAYDAGVLTSERDLADYYEALVAAIGGEPKLAANWVMGELAAALNREGLAIASSKLGAPVLAGLIGRVVDGTVSGKLAKEIFEAMWAGEGEADVVIEKRGLKQISDPAALAKIVDDVIAANPAQLRQYRDGRDKLFGYFVGQAMKATQGKANPAELNRLLKEKLSTNA